MATETFRKPPQAAPLFTGTPTSLVDDAKRLVVASRKAIDEIVRTVTPETAAFANVLRPFADDQSAIMREGRVLGFYWHMSTDQAVCDASIEADKIFDDYDVELMMREDMFRLVDAVLKRNEALDVEDRHYLAKQHQEYIRNGLNLPAGPQSDRFKEIKERLNHLSAEFQKHLNEDKGDIWLLPEDLEGMPGNFVSELEKGVEGENAGKLRLRFDDPNSDDVMVQATKSETRKRFSMARAQSCKENVPIFREAVLLRDEAARMLGYPNHAAFRLEAKMANNPKTVHDFLDDLKEKLTPGCEKEVDRLKAIKKAHLAARGEDFDGRLFFWDTAYYMWKIVKAKYAVDKNIVAEYFPLSSTVSGMLKTFETIFGLQFVEVIGDDRDKVTSSGKGKDIVWHEDVQVFSVWDSDEQGGAFLGYLYLDMFLRHGKYAEMANFNLQPGFTRPDGSRHYPVTAVMCNFSKPTYKKPSLLKQDGVVSLFHELGHGIHDLVAKTKYAYFHGTMTVIDFGEAPSQMLENWCWIPERMKHLSRHYSYLSPEYHAAWEAGANGKPQPPEQIADEIIEALAKANLVWYGAQYRLEDLAVDYFDMHVHEPESREALEKMNMAAEWYRLRHELTKIDGFESLGKGYDWGGAEHVDFPHIVADDYDAGMYGYLYSQVFADDIFATAFKADPMDPKAGLRYRTAVLEKGGGQDELKTVTDFLGRPPKTDAFYKALGLA